MNFISQIAVKFKGKVQKIRKIPLKPEGKSNLIPYISPIRAPRTYGSLGLWRQSLVAVRGEGAVHRWEKWGKLGVIPVVNFRLVKLTVLWDNNHTLYRRG